MGGVWGGVGGWKFIAKIVTLLGVFNRVFDYGLFFTGKGLVWVRDTLEFFLDGSKFDFPQTDITFRLPLQ